MGFRVYPERHELFVCTHPLKVIGAHSGTAVGGRRSVEIDSLKAMG